MADEASYPAATIMPGLVSQHPNHLVNQMKDWRWSNLLRLLRKSGEQVMLDLVLKSCIFSKLENLPQGKLLQISGTPLHDLPLLSASLKNTTIHLKRKRAESPEMEHTLLQKKLRLTKPVTKTLNQITFVRHRLLYGRPPLNKQGDVRTGLRSIHVFSRCPDPQSDKDTYHILQYVFPRQFRLHNAFTSEVNRRESVQAFQDYTVRKDVDSQHEASDQRSKIPRRLRGTVFELVQKLQCHHKQCSYAKLLEHYCPRSARIVPQAEGSGDVLGSTDSFLQHASSHADVSAFVRAVFFKIFSCGWFLNPNPDGQNLRLLSQKLKTFITLRRFESMTLHELKQGLLVPAWARHISLGKDSKVSSSEFGKQNELFEDFLYFAIDGFVVPLISSHFYVTESSLHRGRLFYFRHDVWRALCNPVISKFCLQNFDPLTKAQADSVLGRRVLGYSQVRFLPKATGLRMLMNLRRRGLIVKNGKPILGRSINSVMAGSYNIMNYERLRDPGLIGASLFSVGDIYPKLRAFKQTLDRSKPLYFAKVDVTSCFDTIPQDQVLAYVASILSEAEYRLNNHVEVMITKWDKLNPPGAVAKSTRRFIEKALPSADQLSVSERVSRGKQVSAACKESIVVDRPIPRFLSRAAVKKDLYQHISQNIVKIGGKYYRQRQGVPQGSVCSSLLVNFFYAAFEREDLGFIIDHNGSLLLRLIDDFLLITTEDRIAERFLKIMHTGDPRYGIAIRPEKSLTSFPATIDGKEVPQIDKGAPFPYCGMLIDTRSLAVCKDFTMKPSVTPKDSLTIHGSNPGRNFEKKMLASFKLTAMKLFYDTHMNGKRKVVEMLRKAFQDVKGRMNGYLRETGHARRGKGSAEIEQRVVRRAKQGVVQLAWGLLKGREKRSVGDDYQFDIRRETVEQIGAEIFGL